MSVVIAAEEVANVKATKSSTKDKLRGSVGPGPFNKRKMKEHIGPRTFSTEHAHGAVRSLLRTKRKHDSFAQ
jgi:hypothetical protein